MTKKAELKQHIAELEARVQEIENRLTLPDPYAKPLLDNGIIFELDGMSQTISQSHGTIEDTE